MNLWPEVISIMSYFSGRCISKSLLDGSYGASVLTFPMVRYALWRGTRFMNFALRERLLEEH